MVKKRITFFVLVAVLIGVILGILIWKILSPKLGEGVFYFRVNGDKSDLFLLDSDSEGKKIVSIPAQEVDLGKYKSPSHSYISPDSKELIYFKKFKEEPIINSGQDIVVSRVYYNPILVNLQTGTDKKIDQKIDPASLVFSEDGNNIAWIKEVNGATYNDIEKSNAKRELWISRADGADAKLLASFDENVILLRKWSENYIYFQGLYDVSNKTLGRIDKDNKKIDYIVPKGCDDNLTNCQNIEFSPSGEMFIYEIYSKNNDKEITELYLGDFVKKEFKPILTTDRISDRLWLDNGKGFLYTEQELTQEKTVQETIHLVNLFKETDKVLYSGSYVSQLAMDSSGDYLYFLEKDNKAEQVNIFKLMRLNMKNQESGTVLTENYNNILLVY